MSLRPPRRDGDDADAYAPIGEVPLRYRYRLTTRTKRAAAFAAGLGALLFAGSALFSSTPTVNTLRSPLPVTQFDRDAEAPAFPGAQDRIEALLGQPTDYTARLFSGYLPIGNGGEAFYFFAESQSENAETDPVLLWLNGGPGASSLGGCFSENGPLLVNDDGQSLRVNDYAWNKNANFLCIESPVGVGFSYNTSGVYVSDDLAQADELYAALQEFYGKFPWLRANDFIISGESYGGIYVPTTAKRIVEGNIRGDGPKINLKKFVVGNGVNEFAGFSSILYSYYHGLISTEDYQLVRTSCPGLEEFKPATNFFNFDSLDSPCARAVIQAVSRAMLAHINAYNIYGNCYGSTSLEDDLNALVKELLAPAQGGLAHPIGNPMSMCLKSDHLVAYFNTPMVRTAMHTKPEILHWDNDAATSTSIDIVGKLLGLDQDKIGEIKRTKLLDYTGTLKSTVTPLWTFLLAHDVEGVIYHGDVDLVCDLIGGLWAVESLKLPRKEKRVAWTVELDGGSTQTAGFVEDFGALKYVTVKGAGHLVPQWKPIEAKEMLDRFVLNKAT